FLPRPLLAVVEQDGVAGGVERRRRLLGLLLRARERDDVDRVGRDAVGPRDPAVVASLLDNRGHDPGRTDSVAAHHDRLLLSVLVQEHRAERLRVARSELEDVSHLDRRLEAERTAALRASVALARLPDVRDARLEVAPLPDAAQVPAGPARAGDELTRAERLVGDDLSLEADRAERARVRAERGADLFLGRRAK